MDEERLMAALSFWCSATNTMVLPLGLLCPTVLDISAILETSSSGLPIDAALFGCSSNLDLKALFDAQAVKTLSRDGQETSKDRPTPERASLGLSTMVTNLLYYTSAGCPQLLID